MIKNKLDQIPMLAAVTVVVMIVAACAIRLRGDESQTGSSASVTQDSDPLAAKLARCRAVTYEQKDALLECRKVWAEKRRQFLGPTNVPSASPDNGAPQGDSLFLPPKDEQRLPSGNPAAPTPKSE